MDIWEWLIREWKEEVIIKSIVFSTIINIFKEEKKIDISSYLISIQKKGNTILIKTNKPIINTQLLIYSDKIKKISKERLKNVWIKLNDIEIRYI